MRLLFLFIAIGLMASCTTSGSIGLEPGSWSLDRQPPTAVESVFSSSQKDEVPPLLRQQPIEATATKNLPPEKATDGDYLPR